MVAVEAINLNPDYGNSKGMVGNKTARQLFNKQRSNIDTFIDLDDDTLLKMSYAKTLKSVDDDRHRKLTNGLITAIPFAFGLSAAANTAAAYTSKGRLEKLLAFSNNTVKLFASFGIIGLVFGLRDKIEQKVQSARDFSRNNPILSSIGTAAAAFAAISLAGKGFYKLTDKPLTKFVDKYDETITRNVLKLGEKLDNNKILNKISEGYSKISEKTPAALKELGKTVLAWSPLALGIGAIAHQINHNSVRTREFAKNYEKLRGKQIDYARLRNAELSVQNDFLKTDRKNVADLRAASLL